MTSEPWKENRFPCKDPLSLIEYLEITSAGHPDPLSAYLPYTTDLKTNMLEPVLNKFINHPHYRNDFRYIKLWVIYADSLNKPEEVYNFLLTKGIGTHSSMLYVALAEIYESYSWFDLAELAYLKALNNRAEPLEKLNELYAKFGERREGRVSKGQSVSVEEIRAIPHLRRLAKGISEGIYESPQHTPIVQRAQSRINMSAFKNTPELDRFYHSPTDNKVAPHSPGLINGRLPLSLI